MKILVSVQNLYPPKGGAELSLQSIILRLSETHDVYVLQPCVGKLLMTNNNKVKILNKKINFPISLLWFGVGSNKYLTFFSTVCIQVPLWKKELEKAIHDINPDVILTQQSFAVPTIEVSKKIINRLFYFFVIMTIFHLFRLWMAKGLLEKIFYTDY